MDALAWQKRLADTFEIGGIVGGEMLPIMQAETLFGSYVEDKFKGFATLNSAFQSFFLQTLHAVDLVGARVSALPSHEWYRPVTLSYVGIFHLFRASDQLFRTGHPLNGYSLIRDIKDRAFAFATLANGLATFEQVNGWDAARVEPPETFTAKHASAMRKARQKIDSFILTNTIGKKSGFPTAAQEQLFKWNDLFHNEVHGGRLTFALEGADWLAGKAPLPVFPDATTKADSLAMFINRFEEAAWLTLRCLCYLQSRALPFNDRWRERWSILDDSLFFVHEQAAKQGRAVAAEFIELVSTKFAFTPTTTFYDESPRKHPAV